MRADVQLTSSSVFTPELLKLIQHHARRTANLMRTQDKRTGYEDIFQSLCIVVLETERRYRGDNGATLLTYLYNAVRLSAYAVASSLEAPVHVAKNRKKDVWARKIGVNATATLEPVRGHGDGPHRVLDVMDTLPTGSDLIDELEDRELAVYLDRVMQTQAEPEAVSRILFDGEKTPDVAREFGMPVGELRKCVARVRSVLRDDPRLQAFQRAF